MNARDSILSLHNSALVTQYSALSSDDLVHPRQHVGWDRQVDLFGGFQGEGQSEFRRLLYGDSG